MMQEFPSFDWKRIPLFKEVTPDEWYDWRWQMRHNIRDIDALAQVVPLSGQECHDIEEVLRIFRMAITPYYASLMDPANPACPVRRRPSPAFRRPISSRPTRPIPCTRMSIRRCWGSPTGIPTGCFCWRRTSVP